MDFRSNDFCWEYNQAIKEKNNEKRAKYKYIYIIFKKSNQERKKKRNIYIY